MGNLAGNCFRKILWENLVRNSYGKILWENLVGNLVGKSCRKSCGEILQENLVGNSCGKFPIPISKPFLKVIFKICNSSRSTSKWQKMPTLAIFGMFFALFRPLTGNKTSPNYFFLVERVLSFNFVGHM